MMSLLLLSAHGNEALSKVLVIVCGRDDAGGLVAVERRTGARVLIVQFQDFERV
jgi:hypothetical protein